MASSRLPGDLMHADFPPAQKHLRFGVLAASALRSGQDLAQRKGGLPWEGAVGIVAGVALSATSLCLTHCPFRPSNAVRPAQGRVHE
jgi:hypothetical protein